MNAKKFLLAVSAAAVLCATGASVASADPYDHHGPAARHEDRVDHRMDRRDDRRDVRHDRYWRSEYRGGYVDRDRVFMELRQHHYGHFVGNPYWYNGRYVVRSYEHGHTVYLEVNPYTGGFIGVLRF